MPDWANPNPTWPDQRLVESCLDGEQKAWNALVDKYKNLVYSIAVKYGASSEEGEDLFQTIWFDVYLDLGKLRKKASLRSWLISLATHRCYQWKQAGKKDVSQPLGETAEQMASPATLAPELLEELQRHQTVREAVQLLDAQCRKLVHLLFYSTPRLPYDEVARQMGLARGSISFLRRRCLERLERKLKRFGLK